MALAQGAGHDAAVRLVLGEGLAFDAATLVDLARNLARRPYAPPASDLPEPFVGLSFERYAAIRALPPSWLWAGEGRGFVVEPLHRGFVFGSPATLFAVEDGVVRRILYDVGRFDLGGLRTQAPIGDLGFSGLRVHLEEGLGQGRREIAIFQGASFFRAAARGQNLGVMARGLTLRPAEIRGEEFAAFRHFWIERPSAARGALTLHALLDGPSATGAYRFTIRPGDETQIDVEATLFARAPLDHIGLGGMTSTFLHSPLSRRMADDTRPAAHESGGLQMLTGAGEWIWRSLSNPETLQISVFLDNNPRGFGLLQREREAGAFDDEDQRFELRPSLWIEPIGDWGEGAVQLLEIPTDSDVNDNVLTYWRPKAPVPAGGSLAFAYRQHWCWSPPDRPPSLLLRRARSGRGGPGRRRRFSLDFTGDVLARPGFAASVQPLVAATPGAVSAIRLRATDDQSLLRLRFDLDPGAEAMSELRVQLMANGRPVSETWLYRWTP